MRQAIGHSRAASLVPNDYLEEQGMARPESDGNAIESEILEERY